MQHAQPQALMSEWHILVVDDDQDNLRIIAELVEQMPLPAPPNLILANNGQSALKLIESQAPDIIITDWEMPVMDGIDLLRHVKANPATAEIPVLMVTGIYDGDNSLKEALEDGASDFIRKPVNPIEFQARVGAVMRFVEGQRHIAAQHQRLEQSNLKKDLVLSILSHDLRSPLNTLKGFLQAMAMAPEAFSPAELTKLAEKMGGAVNNTLGLIDNILYWSQAEMGRLRHTPKPLALDTLARRTLELYRLTADQKGIALEAKVADALRVQADENMLFFILRNLVGNALKFTEKGGSITIAAQPSPNGEKAVQLTVHDTGTGMSQEDVARLFQEDQSLTREGTKKELGSGLGLRLCKQFAEKNEGSIWAESTLGQGTTFYVSLYQP